MRELRGSGGGEFFKWPTPGTKFRGEFRALGSGEYQGRATFHAVFIDPQGKTVKVNTPTILRDQLGEAKPGEIISIEYTGNLAGKGGKAGAKMFRTVVVDSEAAPAAPAPALSGDIADMRAKLESRLGPDITNQMVDDIVKSKGLTDVEGVKTALAGLLALHGIK